MTTQGKVGWTPGPWKFDRFDAQLLISTTGERVAGIHCHLKGLADHDQCAANARLIAKAPQLVECLREMVENFTSSDPELVAIRKRANALLTEIGGAQ